MALGLLSASKKLLELLLGWVKAGPLSQVQRHVNVKDLS